MKRDLERNHEDDYLFDGTGPVDPEVARLEALLQPLARKRMATRRPERPGPSRTPLAAAAIAASIILGFLAMWFRPAAGPGFRVVNGDGDTIQHLRVGEWLDTRGDDRVRVQVANIGTVDVEPGSRVRLLGTSHEEHRLRLDSGRLTARVDAPPRLFLVETPAATAVDLGCAYTLTVGDDGDGILEVRLGYVLLENPDTGESFVPRGARCSIDGARGPGIPYVIDAAPAVRDVSPSDPQSVRAALDAARSEDTLTLFHLIPRVPRSDREAVLARIEALDEPWTDPQIARVRILDADPVALAALRDSLWYAW